MSTVSAEKRVQVLPPEPTSIEVRSGRIQTETPIHNGTSAPHCRFELSLTPDRDCDVGGFHPASVANPMIGRSAADWASPDDLAAVAGFLIDTTHGMVPIFTVARMIGCFFLAERAPESMSAVTVSLKGSDGTWAMARVNRKKIAAEKTVFGRAIILQEDTVLGLYVLEIAPGHTIPPHAHEVMRERELILDEGLLQQDCPVRRGLAFDWPLGHVHAYHNPTDHPLRVLCVDAPKFMPHDELPLDDPPPLEPVAPLGDYLGDWKV